MEKAIKIVFCPSLVRVADSSVLIPTMGEETNDSSPGNFILQCEASEFGYVSSPICRGGLF